MIEDCTILAAAIAEAAITGDFNILQVIKDLGRVAEDFAHGIISNLRLPDSVIFVFKPLKIIILIFFTLKGTILIKNSHL